MYNGNATRISVIKSGGVMMAANNIMIISACFRYLDSILALIIPIFAKIYAMIGS
jgi:hypothetical protein